MFSTGQVIHYVKEYSQSQIREIEAVISEYVDKNTIDPPIKKGQALQNLLENLPIGTIVCIDMSKATSKKAHICFPMFSSHISLPVNKGEIVWFYKDNNSSFDSKTQIGTPTLSVNNFWLTKKIGCKISEDLNYAHLMRDSLINNLSNNANEQIEELNNTSVKDKKNNKAIKAEELKKIRIPDYEHTLVYTEKYPFLSNVNDLYNESIDSEELFPNAIPRWYSKPYELSLQGSNNSLVNLTKTFSNDEDHKNKGAIDLVAGRHVINDYIMPSEEDESFYIIKDKFIINIADEEKRKVSELKFDKNNPMLKVMNANEDFEILKNQKYYFGEDFTENIREGNVDLVNDASRVYISEFDQVDNFSVYDTNNLENQKSLAFPLEAKENEYSKPDFLKDEESIKFSNFITTDIDSQDKILPSILIKTNNIRLVAREKKENTVDNKVLDEGSIRLIKQSNNFENYSHIAMESDGQIAIDGSTILLGNINKEYLRQGIVTNQNDTPDEEKLSTMHGNGYGVLIGYDEAISEPLVLGNSLEAIIKELININILLVDEIKSLTDDLQSHMHAGVTPGPAPSGPPVIPTPYITFSTTSQDTLKKRYVDIQNNLKEMLSRFAKTS
jgi:hypothetical protein